MGHAHGVKWTDELVKEKVMEVINAYGLDRMPTRSECERHFRDYALTNVISKRFGWYALANELGLPIKESETTFGKMFEKTALEQLISLGHEVRQMSQNFPYDLLVNDCVKVDVKASKLYQGKTGSFYSFNLEKPFCTCDIYILYLVNSNNEIHDTLILPSKFVATINQISVGEKTSKYYRYSGKWSYVQEYIDFMEAVS